MWGSTREGKRLPTWPGETSPRAVQPHRGLVAARPPRGAGGTLPRGWIGVRAGGTSLAERLPAFTPRVWGLRVGCRIPPLPPSSFFPCFLYLSCSNVQAATLHRGQGLPSLFYKYFYPPFFFPGVGCQIGSSMNAAGRERGADEPGTERVSRGVGLGRAV